MFTLGIWYYLKNPKTIPSQQNQIVNQVLIPEPQSKAENQKTEIDFSGSPELQWQEFKNTQFQFKYPKTDYIKETAIFNGGMLLFDSVNTSAFVIHLFDKNSTFPMIVSPTIIWQKLLDVGILGNLDCELAYFDLVIPTTDIKTDCYDHQNWDYSGDLKEHFPYEELTQPKIDGRPAIGMAIVIPAKDEGFTESFYFIDLGDKYGIIANITGSSLGIECPPAYLNGTCPGLDEYFNEILNSVKFLKIQQYP